MGGRAEVKHCLFILSLFFCYATSAKTIHVGSSHPYKTVTAGLEAALAGDTVLVDAGHYKEKNLVINKRIFLIGINYPVLDGEKKYEIISIMADAVVVDGFKIIGSGISSLQDLSGIKIYDSKKVIVKNNILEDTFFGIYTQNGVDCTIENNRLISSSKGEQQNGNGIHCWKSEGMRIIGNQVTGHRDGIYLEFVTNSIIWRNTSIKNVRYGLHFMFSNDDTYVANVFSNNGSGVSVMFSQRIKMLSNYFEENWGDAAYGILLKEISDGYMEGNHFRKNTSAIYMEGANRILMKRNTFENNGWALKIQASCMDVVLEQNNFVGNTFDVGTNGSLVLNRFTNNYWDKYEGYDLDKDKIGDIPYRPVSMFSMIVEKYPTAMILFRTFITALLDKTEKILPSLTPENLKDTAPLMKKAF
ncbi:nitrous oxide reductase family maturation protein NosD [Daejeonella oryzae]|uniref:nitrous oxide reductase family maturation protein NosD n=1 Tax=Daejeonella oryzae TaxID=1122943 RepID=UPI000402A19B|nr:nitrous oxide reductase family maturation protein NosD [Daejeonella oryzae]